MRKLKGVLGLVALVITSVVFGQFNGTKAKQGNGNDPFSNPSQSTSLLPAYCGMDGVEANDLIEFKSLPLSVGYEIVAELDSLGSDTIQTDSTEFRLSDFPSIGYISGMEYEIKIRAIGGSFGPTCIVSTLTYDQKYNLGFCVNTGCNLLGNPGFEFNFVNGNTGAFRKSGIWRLSCWTMSSGKPYVAKNQSNTGTSAALVKFKKLDPQGIMQTFPLGQQYKAGEPYFLSYYSNFATPGVRKYEQRVELGSALNGGSAYPDETLPYGSAGATQRVYTSKNQQSTAGWVHHYTGFTPNNSVTFNQLRFYGTNTANTGNVNLSKTLYFDDMYAIPALDILEDVCTGTLVEPRCLIPASSDYSVSYQWTQASLGVVSNTASATLNALSGSNTTYTLTVTVSDANGVVFTASKNVLVRPVIVNFSQIGDVCLSGEPSWIQANVMSSCGTIASQSWTYGSNPTVLGTSSFLPIIKAGVYHYTIVFTSGAIITQSYTVPPCCSNIGQNYITLKAGRYVGDPNVLSSTSTNDPSANIDYGDVINILAMNPKVKDIYVEGSIAIGGNHDGYNNPLILDGYNFYMNTSCSDKDPKSQIRFVLCDAKFTNCTFQTVRCDCMWEGVEIFDDAAVPGDVGVYEFENSQIRDALNGIRTSNFTNIELTLDNCTFQNNWESLVMGKKGGSQTYYNLEVNKCTFDSDFDHMLFPHRKSLSLKHVNFQNGMYFDLTLPINKIPARFVDNVFTNAEYGVYYEDIISNPTLGLEAKFMGNKFARIYRGHVYSIPSALKLSTFDMEDNEHLFSQSPKYLQNAIQYGVYSDHDLSITKGTFNGDFVAGSINNYVGVYHKTTLLAAPEVGNLSVDNSLFNGLNLGVSVMPTGFSYGATGIASDKIDIQSNIMTDIGVAIQFRENTTYSNAISGTFSNGLTQNNVHCNEFIRTSNWKPGVLFDAISVNTGTSIGDIGTCTLPGGNEIIGSVNEIRSIWNLGLNTMQYSRYDNENMENYAFNGVSYTNCNVNATISSCPGTPGTLSRLARSNQTTNLEEELNIVVYPNPSTQGRFEIQLDNANEGTFLMEIMNVHGKVLIQQSILSNQKTIDLTAQSKGLYLLKITDGIQTWTRKLIYQ